MKAFDRFAGICAIAALPVTWLTTGNHPVPWLAVFWFIGSCFILVSMVL